MRLHEITKKQPPAPDDMVERLEQVRQELQREFVALRLSLPFRHGKYKNQSHDIPFIGKLTSHPTRDEMMVNVIGSITKMIINLLERPRDYITVKRIAALRQKCFVLVHLNRNAGAARKNWNEKSAKFLAGKLLLGTFDKYFNWKELNR
jgi:hypothetical protein